MDSATVPGAIDGWAKLLDRFGTMKFKQVLEPAIRDADQGFPLSERIHTDWRGGVNLLRRDPDSAAVFLKDNQVEAQGDATENPWTAPPPGRKRKLADEEEEARPQRGNAPASSSRGTFGDFQPRGTRDGDPGLPDLDAAGARVY